MRSISVSGRGEASGVPDVATLRFSASSRAEGAADALAANAEKTASMRDRLRELGVEARDMQTSGLYLNPYYQDRGGRYDRSVIAGYEASNTLTVRLRELERAGATIDAAVQAGANGLDGLSFGFDDQDELMAEARREAVRDARETATLLAEEAGARLGRVLTISEGGGGDGPRPAAMRMDMAAEAAPTPIEAGEQAVTANVQVTFALE